jgi:hypothetical protein
MMTILVVAATFAGHDSHALPHNLSPPTVANFAAHHMMGIM